MWNLEILNIFFDLCTAMSETEEMTPCPIINPLSIQAQEKKQKESDTKLININIQS